MCNSGIPLLVIYPETLNQDKEIINIKYFFISFFRCSIIVLLLCDALKVINLRCAYAVSHDQHVIIHVDACQRRTASCHFTWKKHSQKEMLLRGKRAYSFFLPILSFIMMNSSHLYVGQLCQRKFVAGKQKKKKKDEKKKNFSALGLEFIL